MKKVVLIVFKSLVLALLFPVLTIAQEPLNYVVFEEHVSPSVRSEFVAVQEEAVQLWKKHEIDIPVFCYTTNENSFYWVVPISNFASIDTMFKKMSKVSEKMKADGYDGAEKFKDLSTITTSVIRWDPELSYNPNSEYGQTMDKRYVEWMFCYLRSGHEKEAADAIKKYIDFYNEKKEDYSWDVFHLMMGTEMPALIFMIRSESPVALHTLEEELNDKYKSEFDPLWKDFAEHLRKTEFKTGWFIPKFSMLPEE